VKRGTWYLPVSVAVAVAIAIAGLALTTYRGVTQTRGLVDDAAWITHTHEVRQRLRDLLVDLTTSETSVRGFLLTDDEELLAPFHEVRGAIQPMLRQLVRLTADSPAQQGRLAVLTEQIDRKLEVLDRAVATQQTRGAAVTRPIATNGDGRRSMSEIRRLITELDAEESNRLAERSLQTATRFRRSVNAEILSGVAAVSLLIFVALIVNRQLSERAETNDALRDSEARYRSAAAAAERANVLKDEFLAILSHELRTPLNAVLGWTQMLRAGTVKGPTIDRAVAAIDRNARAQQRLVEDLLDVSRIVTGKFDVELKPLHLATVVGAAIDAARPTALELGIDLQVRIVGSPIVNGDMYRAQQVVGNLLSNALKFTPRGGHVLVDLTTDGTSATLVVKDSGFGIRADLQPFIFDRFRQGDSTTTRAHSGLGLGLAIVRHIVELHGGKVRVASAGENQGATFTVTWPVLESDTSRGTFQSTHRDAAASSALSGTTILLVDDDPDSCEMMTFALEQCGAKVASVADTAGALACVERLRPDVIVTDLQMPNGSGFDLLRELRALKNGRPTIPVLAVTAHARPEDARSALAAGFTAYLTKPIDVAEMIHALGAAAGQS
jgi:signal transduction histidine kinase/ActR/RegA family two-component response regulator